MRRTVEQTLSDMRQQIRAWATGEARSDVRVLVYEPELEPIMLRRLPEYADNLASEGIPVEIVDVGQGIMREIERRKNFVERLSEAERRDPWRAKNDMHQLADQYLKKLLGTPVELPAVCRIMLNTGSLATVLSFSAITNEFYGEDRCPSPNILAFPGEGDERSLNLLRLRADTNYRVARI
jgi:hypothetical protein